MITVIECIKAVTELMEINFGSAEMMNKDVEKGYKRPCIYIDVENSQDEMAANGLLQQTHGFAVYYFAESINKGFLELLKMRNKFTDILRGRIMVAEDFYICPDNIIYDISGIDMALKVTFEVMTVQEIDDIDENEYIETLEVNIKKE